MPGFETAACSCESSACTAAGSFGSPATPASLAGSKPPCPLRSSRSSLRSSSSDPSSGIGPCASLIPHLPALGSTLARGPSKEGSP
ncbi:hypothetical protein ACFPRL_29720 [Pseudoclavibacter helvolus]